MLIEKLSGCILFICKKESSESAGKGKKVSELLVEYINSHWEPAEQTEPLKIC